MERIPALKAIAEKLTAELADSSGRDSATIAHELRNTLAELDRLAPAKGLSRIDELASRRAGRGPGAKGRAGSAGDESGAS